MHVLVDLARGYSSSDFIDTLRSNLTYESYT